MKLVAVRSCGSMPSDAAGCWDTSYSLVSVAAAVVVVVAAAACLTCSSCKQMGSSIDYGSRSERAHGRHLQPAAARYRWSHCGSAETTRSSRASY